MSSATPPPTAAALPSSAQITASSGSNLALAFGSLPAHRRRGMAIFYAFCRVVDDASDEETLTLEEKRVELAFWRAEVARACSGGKDQPLSPSAGNSARSLGNSRSHRSRSTRS